MKIRIEALIICLLAILSVPLAAYTYFYNNTFTGGASIDSSHWTANGALPANATAGIVNTDSIGGALISNQISQTDYEVKETLTIGGSGSGLIAIYLRASTNSNLTGGNQGTYYAPFLMGITCSNGACTGTLYFAVSTAGRIIYPYYAVGVPLHNGSRSPLDWNLLGRGGRADRYAFGEPEFYAASP